MPFFWKHVSPDSVTHHIENQHSTKMSSELEMVRVICLVYGCLLLTIISLDCIFLYFHLFSCRFLWEQCLRMKITMKKWCAAKQFVPAISTEDGVVDPDLGELCHINSIVFYVGEVDSRENTWM